MKKPLGHNARHLPRYRSSDNRAVDDAVGSDTDATPTITRSTAGGDSRKLRGIPAIGYGVAGAIAGTAPHLTRHTPITHYP